MIFLIVIVKDSNEANEIIRNWLRNRNTIEFLGLWEHLHNPNFKPVEFDGFKKEAGLNSFTMSPKKWNESTNAQLIKQNIVFQERLITLNEIAIEQLELLLKYETKKLGK